MSEILEGVIYKSKTPVELPKGSDLNFVIDSYSDFQLVLNIDGKRVFSQNIEKLAEYLSKVYGLALIFRYDSRIGYRYSSIFVDGKLKREFTEQDELYVLLDDDGNPLVDGRKFTFNELDDLSDDEEYETCKNAVELGIESFGISVDWESLKEKAN